MELRYDELLSNCAFNCNLRHYCRGPGDGWDFITSAAAVGRCMLTLL